MSRYYDCYDKDGEPISILPQMPEASVEITAAVPASEPDGALDEADLLYEDLRDKGLSHKDARAEVARVYRV